MNDDPQPRFLVEKVEFGTESEGPDYFTTGAFQVTDTTTDAIVASFPWSLDEAYMAPKSYSGPDAVTISDDGTEAVAVGGQDGERRVVLPVATFAVSFDGVPLTHDTDYGALAARIAEDDGPLHTKSWREPSGQWLWKLHERLGKTPAADALEQHVAAFLDDPNPRRRACALLFYYFRADAPGTARLWELAGSRRDLFSSAFPGTATGRTLDDEFVKALSMGLRKHADAHRIEVARAEAVRPGHREDLLIALLDVDAEWVLANPREIAGAQPDRWKDLLYAVKTVGPGDQLGAIALAVVDAGVATRASVLSFCAKRFSRSTCNDIKQALTRRA